MNLVSVVPVAARAPTIPTRGSLGALSVQAFLAVLAAQKVSGTLYLSRAERSALLTLTHGEPHLKTEFGPADGATFDLTAAGAQFSFWPLASAEPQLPSCYSSRLGPLWALPALTEQPLLSTAETGLRGLVARLAADAFSGAVVLSAAPSPGRDTSSVKARAGLHYGLLLFQGGRLGGAAYEEGELYQGGAAALRTLTQFTAALTLHALPEPVVAGLLGWLLGLQISDTPPQRGVPEGFSGLELSAEGARYYRAGTAYLLQARPADTSAQPGTLGLFAACQRVPRLELPGEPHGWEGRRYGLTLRGRDALNPMTELSMRFQSDFGRLGRRALEQFRRDLSVEAAATALDLEVGELGGLVERLEAEGFVRTVGDVSPTPHLQPR